MRRAFVLALVLAMTGANARAADVPTVAAVRERVRLAAGTRPPSERIVVTYDARGLHGRNTTYRIGDDYRELVEEPPFRTQHGRLAKQAWHQNANGETVLDQADPGLATGDAMATTISETVSPVAGYVLASLNAAGSGTKEYIEAATWRVVRRVIVRPTGTTTFAYDDFRTVDGVTQAWHWTVRDGHAENDADYRIERRSNDVSAPDVAIAAPRGTFVEFPAGRDRVSLPVREAGDKFYVRLTIGERGLDFLLDTGASGITIDDDIARQLGLTVYGHYSNAANAGRYVGGRVLIPSIKVGDLAMHDVVMGLTPHMNASIGTGEVRPVGLLGFDFIAALALELDYEHAVVTATAPSSFAAPTAPHTVPLDIRLGTQAPMTDVAINGALGERFLIDTGASGPVLIFDYFRRRHPSALVDLGGGEARNRHFLGVGGAFETQPYQLDSVRLGNVNFKDFLAFVVRTKTAYASDEDGVLGTEFLRLFNVYLDYANSSIYLEPNARGRAARAR